MQTRWWAPQAPRIGPDTFDLQLLEPGGDAVRDLASAVLCLHRTGAAACEAVAAAPLPDEVSLIVALAKAREALADPLVDSVSKCLTGPGSYAGLFVRDVADDAEEAALAVYRTAVSKGVAPPLAAQRAGAVYGVPRKELGKYLSLAADPKTSPVVLADQADRTLFGYVEKLAQAEAAGPVVKATAPRTATRTAPTTLAEWDPDEHPRDANSGRFVEASGPGSLARLRQLRGGGRQAAPAVAEPPPAQEATEEETRQTVQRVKRTQRVKRRAAQSPPQQVAATQRAKTQLAPTQLKLLQRAATEYSIIAPAVLERMETQQRKAELVPTGQSSDFADLLAPIDDPRRRGDYGKIEDSVAWAMSAEDWMAFSANMPGGFRHQARAFRIGHLMQHLKGKTPENEETFEHDGAVERVAEEVLEQYEDTYQPPVVRRVTGSSYFWNDIKAQYDEAYKIREAMAREVLDVNPAMFPPEIYARMVEDEMRHISVVPDANKPEDILVVHQRLLADQEHRVDVPAVYEVVIPAKAAAGDNQGYGKHTNYVIDPNQAYQIRMQENGKPDTIRYYDDRNQVWRTRVVIEPISEQEAEKRRQQILAQRARRTPPGTSPVSMRWEGGVEKAVRPSARTQTQEEWDEQEHPRDASTGRFVRVAAPRSGSLTRLQELRETVSRETNLQPQQVSEPPPERPEPRQRVQRVRRTQRVQRVQRAEPGDLQTPERISQLQRTAPASLQRPVTQRRLTEQQILARREVQQIIDDLFADDEMEYEQEVPRLHDAGRYTLLPMDEFNDMLENDLKMAPAGDNSMPDRIPLRSGSAKARVNENAVDGFAVETDMYWALEEMVGAYHDLGVVDYDPSDMHSKIEMGRRVHDIFHRDPRVVVVDIQELPGNKALLRVNSEEVPPMILIMHDPAWAGDSGGSLEYLGKRRVRELRPQPGQNGYEAPGSSPWDLDLHVFRRHSPTGHLYRQQGDE